MCVCFSFFLLSFYISFDIVLFWFDFDRWCFSNYNIVRFISIVKMFTMLEMVFLWKFVVQGDRFFVFFFYSLNFHHHTIFNIDGIHGCYYYYLVILYYFVIWENFIVFVFCTVYIKDCNDGREKRRINISVKYDCLISKNCSKNDCLKWHWFQAAMST